jgi:hypothetical protein
MKVDALDPVGSCDVGEDLAEELVEHRMATSTARAEVPRP